MEELPIQFKRGSAVQIRKFLDLSAIKVAKAIVWVSEGHQLDRDGR